MTAHGAKHTARGALHNFKISVAKTCMIATMASRTLGEERAGWGNATTQGAQCTRLRFVISSCSMASRSGSSPAQSTTSGLTPLIGTTPSTTSRPWVSTPWRPTCRGTSTSRVRASLTLPVASPWRASSTRRPSSAFGRLCARPRSSAPSGSGAASPHGCSRTAPCARARATPSSSRASRPTTTPSCPSWLTAR